MRLGRWISFTLKMSKLSGNKELARKVLNAEDPEEAVKSYYSDNQELQELEQTLKKVRNDRDRLKGDVQELEDTIQDLKNAVDHPKQEFWNTKYEKKLVRYRRHIYDGQDLRERSIPVTNFVQPNDLEIRNHLREEDMFVENPMKINKDVPEIYHLAKEEYDYEFDRNNLGELEFWLFPFETRELNGDCEDWAHVIASYLIAAGVPSWRVRVIAGGTLDDNYGGHSTVYVLADDLETWHHLNSTEPEQHHQDLSKYPEWGEETGLNIDPQDVWVAFNDQYGWQDFESEESVQAFQNSEYSDRLTVEDWPE